MKMQLRKRNSISILQQTIDFKSSSRRIKRNVATPTDVIVVDKDEFLQSVIEEEPTVTGLQDYEELQEEQDQTNQEQPTEFKVSTTVIEDISKYVEDLEKLGIDLSQYRSRSASQRSKVSSPRERTISSRGSATTPQRKISHRSRAISPISNKVKESQPPKNATSHIENGNIFIKIDCSQFRLINHPITISFPFFLHIIYMLWPFLRRNLICIV